MAEDILASDNRYEDNNLKSQQAAESLRTDLPQRTQVRYFIEKDETGNLLLPAIDLQAPDKSLKPLREAFEVILDQVKVNPVEFKQDHSRATANLVITSQVMGTDKFAITDVTRGGQARIIFNSRQPFDRATFETTTIHAFERAFCYPKRDGYIDRINPK